MLRLPVALRACATGVVLACALASPALAQEISAEQRDKARQHFKSAITAEKAKDFKAAVSEYIAAYAITKDPKVFYFIARAHDAGENGEQALVYYRRYLNETTVSAQAKKEVEARIAALSSVEVEPDAGTATETDTGGEAGGEGEGSEGGEADGEGEGEGGGEGETETGADTGAEAETDAGASLSPDDELLAVSVAPGVNQPPPPRPRWQRTAAWASVGLASACLAAGGVLATSALSREEDLDRLMTQVDGQTGMPLEYAGDARTQYEDTREEGESFKTYATAAFVGAGVAAGAAAVFFYLDSRSSGESAAVPAPVARRTALAPFIGPHGAGISTSWEF